MKNIASVEVGRLVRWVRKVGQVGFVWFGLKGFEFNTMNQCINEWVGIALLGQLKIICHINIEFVI